MPQKPLDERAHQINSTHYLKKKYEEEEEEIVEH